MCPERRGHGLVDVLVSAYAPVPRVRGNPFVRLYPPAWLIVRHTEEEAVVGGYTLPAHATLALSPYVVHRDPDQWTAPDTFAPARWLEAPSDGASAAPPSRSRHAYFPFGAGSRICVGNTYALTEAAVVLAAVAGRRILAPVPGRRVRVRARATLRPRGGLPMGVRSRAGGGAAPVA